MEKYLSRTLWLTLTAAMHISKCLMDTLNETKFREWRNDALSIHIGLIDLEAHAKSLMDDIA